MLQAKGLNISKGVIESHASNKNRHKKGHRMIYKTLHRTENIEQHETQ